MDTALGRGLDATSPGSLLNMMHAVSQHGSMSMSAPHGYPMAPPGAHSVDGPNSGAPNSADGENRKHDISEILQQIMNITDQSLDEAQARSVTVPQGLVNTFVSLLPFCSHPQCLCCSYHSSLHLTSLARVVRCTLLRPSQVLARHVPKVPTTVATLAGQIVVSPASSESERIAIPADLSRRDNRHGR